MHSSLKHAFVVSVLMLSDALVLLLSLYAAHSLRICLNHWTSRYDFAFDPALFVWPVLLMLGLNLFAGLYTRRMDFWEETRMLYRNLLFLLLSILSLVALTKLSAEVSRLVILIAVLVLLIALPLSKLAVKYLLSKTSFWPKAINVYGHGAAVQNGAYLFGNRYLGYRVSETSGDAVLIDTGKLSPEALNGVMNTTLQQNRQTLFIPLFKGINLAESSIHALFDERLNLISIDNNLLYRQNLIAKKLFEMLLVCTVLPFLALPFALIALMIKLDSKGPVFFFQKRIGKNGAPFNVIKFRTMHIENQALLKAYLDRHPDKKTYWETYHKLPDDPRITRVGKWLRTLSLDEFPQFINVLRGNMNLIGPRPYMLSERGKLEAHLETITAVAPGLTGLWQVSGRNALTFEQRVELDEWYIRNWSLWMDFVIFLKTFDVVLRKKGIL